MQTNTVMHQASQQNSEKPKPTCHLVKKTGHYRNQCHQLKRETNQIRNETNSADNTNNSSGSAQTDSNPKNFQTVPTRTIQIFKETEGVDLSTHAVRPVVELTTPQRNGTLEQTQLTDRLPGIDDREDKTNPNREVLKDIQMGMSKLQPTVFTRNATFLLWSCM